MSGAEYLTQDDDIDVAGAFAALRRRWWLVALVTILAGAGLFFGLSTLDPKYQSDARILIKDGNNQLLWSIVSSWEIAVKTNIG